MTEETTKYDDFIDDCIRILNPDKIEAIMDKFRERVIELDLVMDAHMRITNEHDGGSFLELYVSGLDSQYTIEHQLIYCEHCDVVYLKYEYYSNAQCLHKMSSQHCCECGQTWIEKETDDSGENYIIDTNTHDCKTLKNEEVLFVEENVQGKYMEWYKCISKHIIEMIAGGKLEKFLCELSETDNPDANETYKLHLHAKNLSIGQSSEHTKTMHTCCSKCEKVYTAGLETKDCRETFGHCCECGNTWTTHKYTFPLKAGSSVWCSQKCPNCFDE